jgi:hypothetical protein
VSLPFQRSPRDYRGSVDEMRADLFPVGPGTAERPDWVMCGGPGPCGVRLLASKEMTKAELSVDFGYEDRFMGLDLFDPLPWPRSRRITLTAGVKTFILIDAPDYPSAFRALFEKWTPGPGERVALPGMPAIEA